MIGFLLWSLIWQIVLTVNYEDTTAQQIAAKQPQTTQVWFISLKEASNPNV